jgi:hypothetical protein
MNRPHPPTPSPHGHWYYHNFVSWVYGRNGYYFDQMDDRLQGRFRQLVSEHTHTVNATVTGLSALPSTAKPFASVLAMSRFLNNENATLPALIEPAQDAVRLALAASTASVALLVHDWCMFAFHTHTSKRDRYQRSHGKDFGYELGTALVVDAAAGRPLGPMEFRLRTANGMLSTRPGGAELPPGHIDELLDAMRDSRRWKLARPLVHVIDREADSVGHYRAWHIAGHKFVVRADATRWVTWQGQTVKLSEVATALRLQFQDVLDESGHPRIVKTQSGAGRIQVVETTVVLDRPAKTRIGDKRVEVPGPPLPLRLILSRVVDDLGVVRAEWLLFTNVRAEFDAATVAQWYYFRWQIESYQKLLKSAGMNAEEWEQESGEAFAKRLVVASMACLTVWHLRKDDSEDATRLKIILVRLSGRQMKWGVKDTAPSLLAGLEKLLAVVDVLSTHSLDDILALARRVLPTLFRSG